MTETHNTFDLTFVRHGESVGNAENRFQGQADYPLSEKGRQQAHALAESWHKEGITFDYVIASPLERARETAEIIGRKLNLPPVELDPIWLERDNGKRSGMTWDEVQLHYPDPAFVNPYARIAETGEGDWALYLRGGQAVQGLLLRQPGRYLISSHGAILNMVFYAIMGIAPQPNFQGPRFRLENTSYSRFIYYPDTHRWRVDVIGQRSHLV